MYQFNMAGSEKNGEGKKESAIKINVQVKDSPCISIRTDYNIA